MKKTIAAIAAATLALLLAGCNTIKGAGQDIQKAGSAVEKAADKAK
jgi:entericidin A